MKTALLSTPALIVSIFLLIVTMVPMVRIDTQLKNEVAPNGIVSFELAGDLKTTQRILKTWEKPEQQKYLGLSLGYDYFFMVGYATILFILVARIERKLTPSGNRGKFLKLLLIGIWIAALFDAIENFALINLFLGDMKQIWSSLALYFASAKFIILTITILTILTGWIAMATKLKKA